MPVSPEVHEAALQAATDAMESYLRSERKWQRPLTHLHDGIHPLPENANAIEDEARARQRKKVKQLVKKLPYPDREIMTLRWLTKPPVSRPKLSGRFGITVRQIERMEERLFKLLHGSLK